MSRVNPSNSRGDNQTSSAAGFTGNSGKCSGGKGKGKGKPAPKGTTTSLMRERTCLSPIRLTRSNVHAVGLCGQKVVALAMPSPEHRDNAEGRTTALRVLGSDSPPHFTTEFWVPLKRIHASADRSALPTLPQEIAERGQDTLRGEVDPRGLLAFEHIERCEETRKEQHWNIGDTRCTEGPSRSAD